MWDIYPTLPESNSQPVPSQAGADTTRPCTVTDGGGSGGRGGNIARGRNIVLMFHEQIIGCSISQHGMIRGKCSSCLPQAGDLLCTCDDDPGRRGRFLPGLIDSQALVHAAVGLLCVRYNQVTCKVNMPIVIPHANISPSCHIPPCMHNIGFVGAYGFIHITSHILSGFLIG